jgi:antitoxin VapB
MRCISWYITGMAQTKAKLFNNGRSQAVRLPASFRFEGTEVYIRRDPHSGDVILSRRPQDWSEFLALRDLHDPDIAEFMRDRVDEIPQKRKLF